MSKEPTWRDIGSSTKEELQRVYKLDGRQLEQAIRKHTMGATREQIERTYTEFYNRK